MMVGDTGPPEGNPCEHEENIQTPHREALHQLWIVSRTLLLWGHSANHKSTVQPHAVGWTFKELPVLLSISLVELVLGLTWWIRTLWSAVEYGDVWMDQWQINLACNTGVINNSEFNSTCLDGVSPLQVCVSSSEKMKTAKDEVGILIYEWMVSELSRKAFSHLSPFTET